MYTGECDYLKNLDNSKSYVYRYTDIDDGMIKYVGIVSNGTLANRNSQHMREEWYKNGVFLLEYIEVPNKSTAEALESHFISLYHTDLYYNKAKAGWGTIDYFPKHFDWKVVLCEPDKILEDMKSLVEFISEKESKIKISLIKDYLDAFVRYKRVKEFISRRGITATAEPAKWEVIDNV